MDTRVPMYIWQLIQWGRYNIMYLCKNYFEENGDQNAKFGKEKGGENRGES